MTDVKRFVFVERQRALAIAETCGLGVIAETAELNGYQTYIVEQWVCDRTKTPNTVKVYTGDPSHTIKVCVIEISTERLRDPQVEIQQLIGTDWPAKSKETPLGDIIVIVPSELPGEMDMVLVPEGDYDKWVDRAYVNINLRRCNCTGRSALNFSDPNPASGEKFVSFYKISTAVHFEEVVIQLVKVAQAALYLFDLLPKNCIDGLICDQTNIAFLEFYKHYGPHRSPEYQLKEPWMEPHLLTALITKLVVCRNKLEAFNFTKIKDPFMHYEKFQFDIEKYQVHSGLRRTRTIDLDTLRKLNETTIDRARVRKVIRSKLDDISGVSNSPLFTEASDPDVFRHHATTKSLRSIWRPKIKNSQGKDMDQNELMNVFKSVSERTTKTGAAAEAILSKVTGWMPASDRSTRQQNHAKQPRSKSQRVKSPSPTAPLATYPLQTSMSAQPATGYTLHDDEPPLSPRFYSHGPSPGDADTFSSADDETDRGISPESEGHSWRQSPEGHLVEQDRHQDSSVQLQQNLDGHTQGTPPKPTGGDFVQCQRPHRVPRRPRPVSTGEESIGLHSETSTPGLRPRSRSMIAIHRHDEKDMEELRRMRLPEIHMDARTFIHYEGLCKQLQRLQKLHVRLDEQLVVYETTSKNLHATLDHRAEAFERARLRADDLVEEQRTMNARLQAVEEQSAQLQYKLNNANDVLKDAEDNVSTFYGKVGSLENQMDHVEQYSVVLLIKDFIVKLKYWFGFSNSASRCKTTSAAHDTHRPAPHPSSST